MNSETTSPQNLATAYALGELSPEERTSFEHQMENDPALAALAAETREFCSLLDDTLRDPVPALAREKRAALLTAASRRRKPVIWVPWLAGAAAACVAGGVYFREQLFGPIAPAPGLAGGILTTDKAPPPAAKPAGSNPAGAPAAADKELRYASVHAAMAATKASQPAAAPAEAPSPPVPGTPVSTERAITIKPVMPKPLFAGTPLPDNNPPQNLDKSGRPVLEVKVPAGVSLVSKGRPVTSSDPAPLGDLSLVTDGDKEGDDGYFVDILPGKQWVQIDLGQSQEIHLIWLWHYHKVAAIYKDVVVQISDDPEFKTSTTVFNNDWDNSSGFGIGPDPSWVETNNGRPILVKGVTGRYVRCWSNGRNVDDTNHYIEVEVYGRPPAAAPAELAQAPNPPAAPAQVPPGLAIASAPVRDSDIAPASAPAARPIDSLTIRPAMPKPLFAGTPLPFSNPPPNLERGIYQAPAGGVQEMGRRVTGAMLTSGGTASLNISTQRAAVERARQSLNGMQRRNIIDSLPIYGSRDTQSGLAAAEEARQYAAAKQQLEEEVKKLNELAPGTESYAAVVENPFLTVLQEPLSTFSVDVDTASYSNVRRFLNMGQCPPPDAVRLEELVNYFPYDYAQPVDGKPFAVHVEVTSAPWDETHRIARVALKGKEIAQAERPAANLVFLVDVSGSMDDTNKLPLVKQSLRFVVERLTEKDTVSLVTYAGASGVVLPATSGADKARIMAAIDALGAGGSTNGAGGITTAYEQAAQHFHKEGINRVILATDGDFNVGMTSHDDLVKLITEKAKTGVFLSVLGYGMGNTKDDTMELLADKGNGNYAYIDSLSEARKSLGEQFAGTLVTIAKDVKIQIEFNPAVIRSYRLLGYENRMLAAEDFNNDKKDAGEIGAGHTVTALYELVPVGAPEPRVLVDDLKYQPRPAAPAAPALPPGAGGNGETLNIKLRWKAPDADVSQLMEVPVKDSGAKIDTAGNETKWAVAVAGFASMLNGSQFNGLNWEQIRTLARAAKGADPNGYRGEFLQLLDRAESVKK